MAVQPRDAAAVMLLRAGDNEQSSADFEVFMVRRSVQSEFMPDVYVFPGGSVAPADRVVESSAHLCQTVSPTQADPEERTALGSGIRAAAIRELFEEANILLAYRDGALLVIDEAIAARFTSYRQAFNERKGSLAAMAEAERLVLATDHLAYFAHWITPTGLPKRYDTHFFLAQAPTRQQAAYDPFETSAGLWLPPAVALTRFQQGDFPITFPTFHQLRHLATFQNIARALAATHTQHVPTHMPTLVQKEGKTHVYLPTEPEFSWPL